MSFKNIETNSHIDDAPQFSSLPFKCENAFIMSQRLGSLADFTKGATFSPLIQSGASNYLVDDVGVLVGCANSLLPPPQGEYVE